MFGSGQTRIGLQTGRSAEGDPYPKIPPALLIFPKLDLKVESAEIRRCQEIVKELSSLGTIFGIEFGCIEVRYRKKNFWSGEQTKTAAFLERVAADVNSRR
jgi:hypothetical protein